MALPEKHLSGLVELVIFPPVVVLEKNKQIIILEGLSFSRVLKLLYSSNTHRLLFDRSSSALATFFAGQRFWNTQTDYDARRSFRLFRVLKLSYALNKFMCVCKFTSFCRFRDEVRQDRLLMTNEVRVEIVHCLTTSIKIILIRFLQTLLGVLEKTI